MKAFVTGIIIVLNLILQSTLFQYFKIAGVVPNTALILVISLAIYNGKHLGAGIGFAIGILQDIIFGRVLGLYALIYMLIGYGVGYIHRNLFKDNVAVPMLFTAIATVLYQCFNLLLIFLLGYEVDVINFFKKTLIIEVAYNTIFSILIYIYVSKLYKSALFKKRY